MKRLQAVGLCLASVLAVGMVLAGSVAAAPLWLVCKKSTGLTKYTNDQCEKASGESSSSEGWQSSGLPLIGSTTIRLVGFTLRLTDKEAGPLHENSTIVCKGEEESGLITYPNTGVLNRAEVIESSKECKAINGPCSGVEAIKGADLPWKSELFETEKKFLAKAEADGHGSPGWEVTCKTLLGSKTDKCVGSEGVYEEAILENVVSGGVLLVSAKAEKRRKQNCSEAEGKQETGEIEGQGAGLLPGGNAFSIDPS